MGNLPQMPSAFFPILNVAKKNQYLKKIMLTGKIFSDRNKILTGAKEKGEMADCHLSSNPFFMGFLKHGW
jgi:hypothetical protein